MIPPLVFFLLDGRGYLLSCALMLTGVLLLWRAKSRWRRWPGDALSMVGLLIWMTTGPVLAPMVIALFLLLFVGWLLLEQIEPLRRRRFAELVRGAMLAALLAMGICETWLMRWPRLPARHVEQLVVLGDSISAGIGSNSEAPWPGLLEQRHQLHVVNLAIAGATIRSALHRELPQVPGDADCVLIEIGGNDILQNRGDAVFATQLDQLLSSLQQPGRTLIIFELPSMPWKGQHVLAQRRLAKRYGVQLIPRRLFVSVIGDRNHSIDGVHLNAAGHEAMAQLVEDILAPMWTDSGQR
ncbi:MAG: hypothetical protein IT445_10735 [Phycisphaeraceae bacterium]|nr:hypothetical protein [Phycisphaeraceae bacterium]